MSLSKADYHDSPVWQFIYSFHMPLFMTLVGYFSASSLKRDYKSFIKHKCQQLILPFISWFVIGYIAILIMKPQDSLSASNLSSALIKEIWFLKSAFLCYVLFYFSIKGVLWLKVRNAVTTAGCFSIIISQFVPIMKVNQMYPCFFCGYLIYKHFDYIANNWKWISAVSICAFAISYCALINIDVTPMPVIKSRLLQGEVSAIPDLALYQFRLICMGMTATLGLVSLFYGLFRNSDNSVISLIGKSTLAIYVMQTLILEKIMAHYIDLQHLPSALFELLIAPVISLLIIAVCMELTKIIESSPRLSFYLLGKKSNRSEPLSNPRKEKNSDFK